jgi:hypothetical protein
MTNIKNILNIFLCGCFLTSCASITTGNNQSLSVNTIPENHASCELSNDKGVWYINETPASITVSRSYSDLNVICKKSDKSGVVRIKSSTKGMMYGNILAGGIIGGAIDAGTGAGYDYPNIITVPLK